VILATSGTSTRKKVTTDTAVTKSDVVEEYDESKYQSVLGKDVPLHEHEEYAPATAIPFFPHYATYRQKVSGIEQVLHILVLSPTPDGGGFWCVDSGGFRTIYAEPEWW
jgi:hypothetical protein